jgi:hypothetical protein
VLVGLDMDKGEVHFVRAGATALPVVEVKQENELYLAVAMFLEGAACEMREIPLYSPAPLSHLVSAAAVQSFANLYPAGGPPSVPRLSLKSVGSEQHPLSKKESLLTRGPSSSSLEDKSQDPGGPLSARAMGMHAPFSLTESHTTRPSGAGGGATTRPSPRVMIRSTTPRTMQSPEHTPRGSTPRNAQPSPRAPPGGREPAGLLSPPAQPSPFVSPRYVSPRTPRGMLMASPRRFVIRVYIDLASMSRACCPLFGSRVHARYSPTMTRPRQY